MPNDIKNVTKPNKINGSTLQLFGEFTVATSRLEWLIEQFIILSVLEESFDPSRKSHIVLEYLVQKCQFNGHTDLIKTHSLLDQNLTTNLNDFRKRRNQFIHGYFTDKNGELFFGSNKKSEKFETKILLELIKDIKIIESSIVTTLGSKGIILKE